MTEKQKNLFKLFLEVDEICRKHNLRYVMSGGTLIGVWRHEGFIPWDDDMDIYMPRSDWEKFAEICKTELPPNRALLCSDVDRRYTNSFPRYADTESSAIHRHQIVSNDVAGEIIDVLTLDPIPDDDNEFKKYLMHFMVYSELLNTAVVYGTRFEIPLGMYLKYLFSYYFLGKVRTLEKLEKIMFSYKEEECSRYAMRWGGYPFLFDKDMMFPVKEGIFEGTKVMIPQRTSDYLIWHYGARASGEWVSDQGSAYWIDDTTYMAKGWREVNGEWYYLRSNGAMAKNYWAQDSAGVWYYLGENGTMLKNTTTPDGYRVGADGAWRAGN